MKNVYIDKKHAVASIKEGHLEYIAYMVIDGSIQHEIFNWRKETYTGKPLTDEQNEKLNSLDKYLA